ERGRRRLPRKTDAALPLRRTAIRSFAKGRRILSDIGMPRPLLDCRFVTGENGGPLEMDISGAAVRRQPA
ncbi:MAG: hypothetical protein WAL20_02005, partial [Rhodomicrobium sp.]